MDETARPRRKDTTKGVPLRILSLDGGGVRGYSMLIILQELMHRTFVEIEGRAPKRHEIPKPCDHFDLIAGNGTGGLIAIMLGRLRLDLDTCKEVYVRMTRRVFETDKTLMGIPLRGTMFKASKLEEAIRDCVKEHTIFDDEGNDALANATPMTPDTAIPGSRPTSGVLQRSMSQSSRYSQIGMSPIGARMTMSTLRFGNANALLYDTRENRTKTAVTAVLRGTPQTTLLRSYDSRKETAPDVNCTIWQAGRATCATAMAFKPIQVGQSVYLDEGAGKYNPSPRILDEAVRNEWPGREVGVFVSIGTGKRPANATGPTTEWWEGFLGGSMGDFAEARRRLISRLEACEETHQSMLREHLAARGVNVENYYRLNVEVGVGEFGMNEWNRLADISTSTRMYLARDDVQGINCGAAAKLAKVHSAKIRYDRAEARKQAGTDGPQFNRSEWEQNPWERPIRAPMSNPNAVELPGDEGYNPNYQHDMHRPSIADQKYTVVPDSQYVHRPSIADQKYAVVNDGHNSPPSQSHRHSTSAYSSPYSSPQTQQRPLTHEYSDYPDYPDYPGLDSHPASSPRLSQDSSAPPIPPKTPVSGGLPYPSDHQVISPAVQGQGSGGTRTFMNMDELGKRLPYPDVAGPPPPVNNANKPQLSR